jgi:hypothetical protein
VADAAAADPHAESQLLALAKKASLAELRTEAARVKALADPDPEERRRRIHARRHLRSYTDAEGAWHLRVLNNPEVGAFIMAALAPLTDRLFKKARTEGRREPVEAYAADALAELAAMFLGADDEDDETADPDGSSTEGGPRGPDNGPNTEPGPGTEPGPDTEAGPAPRRAKRRRRRGGALAKVITRIDLDCLLRGHALPGETCEIVGFGPVAVSAVYDMLDTMDPYLAAVVTKGEQVMGVAHLGRRANAHQQTALEWLFPECVVLGCSTQSRLETDHRIDWADTHFTLLELLDRPCKHHHDLKTHHGWALVEGRGKRPMVAPDDPRHPRHKPPPDCERAPPQVARATSNGRPPSGFGAGYGPEHRAHACRPRSLKTK